jgi:PilZ domain-containing protein
MESRDPGQTEKDSRDRERILLAGQLHGEIMLFQSMVVREISRGGAQIETTSPLKVDSLHELRVVFGEQSAVLKGRVAHCRIVEVDQDLMTYRSGIEFVDPPEHVQALIVQFIDDIRDGRRRS